MVFTPANRAELITGLNAYFTTGSDYGSKRDDGDDISGEGLKDSSNVVITTVGDMGGINDWDVINVTSFETLFYGAQKINFNEDISNWNTSNVTNFKQVFRNTEFNQNINPKQVTPDDGRNPYTSWDVSKGTDFRSMFYDNEEFDQDISGWQIGTKVTGPVILFNYMFASGSASTATTFNQDISSWDVSKVSNFVNMFMYNTTFNQPAIKHWVVNTTSTGNMFLNANTDMQDIEFNVPRPEGPDITLIGANPLIIVNGVTWEDPGANAADGSTVTITGTVITSADGEYTLTYEATDSTGTRTVTRTVEVRTPTVLELTTPIEFEGETPGTIDLKNYTTTFTLSGVDADKDLITYTSPGSVTVLFYVKDTYGDGWNGTDFNIDVEDASGDSSIEILKNGVPKNVITVENPDNKVWQKFEVTLETDYKIKFGSGSYAIETIFFIVYKSDEAEFDTHYKDEQHTSLPQFFELEDKVLFLGNQWKDPSGVSLTDQTKTLTELMPNLTMDPATIPGGEFTVTQEMIDANDVISITATYGHESATSSIETPDTIAPVITLSGNSSVTIAKDAPYTDAGATANDARDGDVTGSIVTTGSVDISVADTYTITYTVSDAAENQATPIERTVNVVEYDPSVVFKPADRAELVKGLNAYFTDSYYGNKKDNSHDISGEELKDSNGDTIAIVLFMGDIGSWDVSNVINFYSLFNYKTNFNQDISNWNVSNATNMSSMFFNASSFNQDISNWNVSNATNMSSMFYNASSFNQDLRTKVVVPTEGSAYLAWDVKSVTNMLYMFRSTTNYAVNGTSDKQLNWNLSDSLPDSGLNSMFIYSFSNTTLYGVTPDRSKFLGNTLGQNPYAAFTSITDFTESENYTIQVNEGASAQETLFFNVVGATNFKLEILEEGNVKVATDGTATANTAKGGTLELSSIDSLTNQTAFYDDNGTTKYGNIDYTGLKTTLTYTAASDIVGIAKLSENLQVKASYTDSEGQEKTVTLNVVITNLETKHYVAGQTTYTIDLVNEYGAAAGEPDLVTTVTNFADKVVTVNLTHDGVTIPHIFTYTLHSDPQTVHDAGFSASDLYDSGKFVEAEPLLGIYAKTELEEAGYTIWYEKDIPEEKENTTITIYTYSPYYYRIANPLVNIVPLMQGYTDAALTNSKTIRNELKNNNWRFILERTTDNEIFDITEFTDPSYNFYITTEVTNYVYFLTEPEIPNFNGTYKVKKIYNQTPPPDSTAPVITLTGEANVTVNVGGVYNELEATADTGETVIVGGDAVNTNVVRTYTVTYNVTDEAENVATPVERTVTVLPTVQNVSTHTEKNQAKTFSLKYNNL